MEKGYIIKNARLKKNMTQEQLGNMLGVQKSAVAKWENGRVTNLKAETIISLCNILDIDFRDLAELPADIQTGKGSSGSPIVGYVAKELSGLSDHELQDVAEYISFLKSKRR